MDNSLLKTRQQKLIKLFHGSSISKVTGMRLSYNEQDQAVFHMPYNPHFNHALGGIHGGIFATLLDNAGWFTIAPHFETWIATIEFTTRLLKPVAEKELIAIGKIVRLGKSISTAEMKIHTVDGKLAAIGAGSFVLTKVPFPG